MKIKVTEVRVYDVPDECELEVRNAMAQNADEFLCDLSDWPMESETVSVKEVKRVLRTGETS